MSNPADSTKADTQPEAVPSWLAEYRSASTRTQAAVAGDEPEAPPLPSDIPDWLGDMTTALPPEAADEWTAPDTAGVALPDLPSSAPPAGAIALPAEPSAEPSSRSLRSTTSGERAGVGVPGPRGGLETVSGDVLETTGLVAGISGALPVESILTLPHQRRKAETSFQPSAVSLQPSMPPPPSPALSQTKGRAEPARRSGRSWRAALMLAILAVVALVLLLLFNPGSAAGPDTISLVALLVAGLLALGLLASALVGRRRPP